MRNILHKYILLLLGIMLTVTTFAQGGITVVAPRVVVAEQPFQLEFRFDAQPESFNLPNISGLNIIAETQSTFSANVNGQVTAYVSYIISAIPERTGTITIPALKATVRGKTVTSRQYPIESVRERTSKSSGNNQGLQQQQGGRGQQSSQTGNITSDDLILKVATNKKSVYKGEPILVSVYIYMRANVAQIKGTKEPALNGFWKQEITFDPQEPTRQTFNGKVYDVALIKQYLLFPQKSGTLEIEKMQADAIIQVAVERQSSGDPFFDSFFGGGGASYKSIVKTISSAPIQINVKELPTGAPATFEGAVGQFALDASIDPLNFSANSSSTMKLRITGSGNLPLINAPKVTFPASFEAYNTKSSDAYKVSASGVTGSKLFEYPFIARAEGKVTLPSQAVFSYFDIRDEKYKTLSTPEFKLNVTADASGGNKTQQVISGVNKEDVKILNNDIHFILIGNPNLRPKDTFLILSWRYFLTIAIIVALFVAAMVFMKRRIAELRDIIKVKSKRANYRALSRLKQAKRLLNSSREAEFYEEILKALWGYVSDKLNIPAAELSKDNIRSGMTAAGATENDIDELVKIISECEFARYAPSQVSAMSNIYQSSLDLLGRLETKL